MNITLKPIDAENFWDIIALNVGKGQEEHVTSNAVSIAQAKVQPECIPLAIYAAEKPVGFVMYCIDRDDGEYWLYRLMVDAAHQGKGYARQGMRLVLDEIRKDATRHKMLLGVDPGAKAAVGLYESLGFAFTGQVFGKEHVMELRY